jgi:hypothetical protein
MKIGITVDNNNIVNQVAECLTDEHIPFPNGATLETELDLTTITNNYKYVDGQLVALTDEEKAEIATQKELNEAYPPIVVESTLEDYLLDLDYRLSIIELGV